MLKLLRPLERHQGEHGLLGGHLLAREVRLLKGLDHRNVLPLYDAFYRPGADDVFLVTRMMDSDLHQVIYTRDSPPTRAGKG